MAIFEHRPPRDSGRRRQADLSLQEEPDVGSDDLLDLPLGETPEQLPKLRPTAAEIVPIPTDGSAARRPASEATPHRAKGSGAAGWGPTVRPVARPLSGPGGDGGSPRRRPETIGQPTGGGRWLAAFLLLALPLAVAAGYFLNRAPAIAELSTELVDFGELRLGEVAQQPFEITNRGEKTLTINGFEVMGEAAADFTVAGEDCLGRPLAAGEICRVRLAFRPTASASRQARLALTTSSVTGLRTLPLLGVGAAPHLEVSPPSLDFGQHVIGTRSTDQSLWLSNTGSAPLSIRRVMVSGGAAADFVLGRDECSRHELAPGERCTLVWSFVPTATGRRQGAVAVESDASLGQAVQLAGLGLPQEPELRLAPQRLELAATALGEVSPAAEVELFNDGNGPLQIHDVRLQETDSPLPAFRLQGEDCLQRPVVPGTSCRLEVVFAPQREGEVSGFFEILHSAGEGRHSLPLVGRGLAPHLGIEPRRLAFGEVPVGGVSEPRRLELSSTGSAALWVESVRVEGADANAFEIETVDCLDDPLPVGEHCGFDLRFRPRRDGPHRAELAVRHNAEGAVEQLPLNGLGTSPRLELDPASLSFGEVRVGQSAERPMSLGNGGRAGLDIRRLRVAPSSGDEVEVVGDRCSGRRLEPGSRCQILLRFTPRMSGTRGGSLHLEHSASPRPQEIPWRAVATNPPPPRLEARPTSFDFAATRVGEASDIRTLVLRNAGQGMLSIADIRLSGPHRDAFQLVPGTCAGAGPLPPREECSVGVRFLPILPGSLGAEIIIRHNGPGREMRLELNGRGVDGPSAGG